MERSRTVVPAIVSATKVFSQIIIIIIIVFTTKAVHSSIKSSAPTVILSPISPKGIKTSRQKINIDYFYNLLFTRLVWLVLAQLITE